MVKNHMILKVSVMFDPFPLDLQLQGHPERMLKVNPFARALVFTKSGFAGVNHFEDIY